MKTPEQIFDEACLDWPFGSPRLSGDRRAAPFFQSRAKRAVELIASARRLYATKSTLGPVYFDFVDSNQFNAVAAIRDKSGVIGMLSGAALLPFDFFKRLLSHPDVALGVGSPNLEVVGPYHREALVENYQELIDARTRENRPIESFPPICLIRQIFAATVTRIAFDFLLTHELAHIINGHLGYLLFNSRGLPYRIELEPSSSNPAQDDPFTCQTLEMDADSEAACFTLNVSTIQIGNIDPVYTWAFAINGLFYLWGLEYNLADISTASHPPTACRTAIAQSAAWENAKHHSEAAGEAFWDATQKGAADIFDGCSKIGAPMTDAMIAAFASGIASKESQDYFARLKEHWKSIRPSLMNFAFRDGLAQ
jgi:hypothetical protein